MRKQFTLRIEEELIKRIKVQSVERGYSSYADYIEEILIKGLSIDTMSEMKKENKNYTLINTLTLDALEVLTNNIKKTCNIDEN
jgi:hypothetical protein